MWHHYAGDPLRLSISTDAVTVDTLTVGPDLAAGNRPQAVVPPGAWQAAEPVAGAHGYVLVGCTVSPPFTFDNFELAPPDWPRPRRRSCPDFDYTRAIPSFTREVEAFIPDDLPDHVDLPGATWMAVSDAAAELGRLDVAASLIPRPQLIARIATRREAIGTSALEGTYADLTDLFAAEVLPRDEQETEVAPNVREVMNYTRAADTACSWIGDRPLTLGLISALQAQIVRGTPSDGRAGALRQSQVFIGAKNRRVAEARFVPPPPGDQLRARCERWVDWLRAPAPAAQIQLIARVAMAHYQFEALHPFTDGNGRLGRLVTVLQMLQEGALRSPVLALSPWLEERADDYRDHLLAVSTSGDWAPWIEFFAHAVSAESRSGHDRIMRLLGLREEIGEIVRSALHVLDWRWRSPTT